MSEISTRVELIDIHSGDVPASFEVKDKLTAAETERAVSLLQSTLVRATRPGEAVGDHTYRAVTKLNPLNF